MSSHPNPKQEEVSTQSGLKRYFIFLYDYSWLFFQAKTSQSSSEQKKQYWALGADSSTRSGFGEDCFFSVIRMILVIRLVQEVKLWPLRWKTNFNAKPFPLFHSRDQKKKKRALQGYWDICCWSAECMQCQILQIVTTKKNNNKHVKYKTLLKIIVLSMFSLHAALTLLAWAVCFHALCCCVASSRLASCSKS